MTRYNDWENRLAAYLDSVRHAEYRYGEHDCALHAANAVLAMTGEDFAADVRGHYRSVAGSVRALRKYGAGDLALTVTAKLGEPIAPALARRGDVVMNDGSTGICMGDFGYFVAIDAGLVRIARKDWQRAWRI